MKTKYIQQLETLRKNIRADMKTRYDAHKDFIETVINKKRKQYDVADEPNPKRQRTQ